MKILFIYPAKAYLLDAPRVKPVQVTIEGLNLYKFNGLNVYATASKPIVRAAYNEAEGSNHYFIELAEGIIAPFTHADNDEHIAEKIRAFGERIAEIITNAKLVLTDIAGYEEEQRKVIAEKKAAREREEEEKRARALVIEAEAKQAHNNTLEAALNEFKAGNMIKAEHFEELCKQHGVKMPMQTIGALRRSVSAVAPERMRLLGNSKPWGVLQAAKELRAAV